MAAEHEAHVPRVKSTISEGLYDNWSKWEGIGGERGGLRKTTSMPANQTPDPSVEFFIALCEYLRASDNASSSSATSALPLSPAVYEEIKKEFTEKGRDLEREIQDLRNTLRRKEEMARAVALKEREMSATRSVVSPQRALELKAMLASLQEVNEQLASQFAVLQQNNQNISKVLQSILDDLRKVAGVPPTGDVCIAFTDVQGSTTQWEMHPKVMERALALHNEIIRKVIDANEGYEVKTEGDAFMVAFPSAVLALKWAIAVQENLLAADWEDEVMLHPDAAQEREGVREGEARVLWRGLRVRIGIHSGTPRCVPDCITGRMDYFGNMVNKAARVEGGAHGGQILISGDMYSLVKDQLDQVGNVLVKHLGKFPLRGIDGDTELVQVMTPFLSLRAFPPPFKKYLPAPTGEVTICFTDVQGSTTQWEMHPPVMARALAIHNQLMRRRLKEFQGYEVRTEGDAFMVVFEDAVNAVNWALAAQVDLAHADWPEELYNHPDSSVVLDEKKAIVFRGYRVRVGMNTGTPKHETDPTTGRMTYSGRAVMKAGGVENLTYGGQINVSASTLKAVQGRLKELRAHRMMTLGTYMLRGADEEEVVTQILPASLAARSWPTPGHEAAPKKIEIPPPHGEVTLCNTDVQGSTTQWETHPDVMQVALAMHNTLMREYIIKFKGYEVRTEGDAFFVAFQHPHDAVNWALTVQEELMKVTWPEKLYTHPDSAVAADREGVEVFRGMRVRIGIHTATPLSEEDPRTGRMDYFGPVTSHAHLVENAAHGGQIVISESVWERCGGGKGLLPHSLTTLGKYMFAKDEGIELFQILPHKYRTRTFKAPPILHLRSAPRGEVTIVYTDVKGSTTQWEMHPPVMEKALGMHNDIMRKRIQQYNGYEVKTEGDAFMVAFQHPLDAVKWALDVQLDLLRAEWPEALYRHPDSALQYAKDKKTVLYRGMRVRMGMHTGSPKCEPDPITSRMDYFGPTVNKAASIEGASQGGQVLVSGVTFKAIEPRLHELGDVDVQHLGTFKLSGLADKEELVQILPTLLAKRVFAPPLSTPVEVQSLTDLSGKLGGLQSQNSELQKELSSLESSLEQNSQRLADVRTQVMSDKAGSMSAVLLEVSEILQKQSEIQDSLHDAGHQQRQVTAAMDKVDRLLGSMSAKVEDAFTAKSRTEEEYQLWLKKHAAMKDAETQVRGKCEELEKKWAEYLQTGSTAAELKDKSERLQSLHAEEEGKLNALTQRLAEIEKEVQIRKVHANDAAETMKKMEDKHGELEDKEKELRKELSAIEKEQESVNAKIQETEKRKRDLEEEARAAGAAKRRKLHFQAKLSILTDEIEELQNALQKRKEGVPEAINHFEVKKVGASSAYVAWKAPASKSKLTSYAIYIRKMGDEKYRLYDYSTKTIVNIGEGKSVPPDSTKLWMEGLENDTNYELKMRACNESGWGVRSLKSVQFTTLKEGEGEGEEGGKVDKKERRKSRLGK